jgi:hypothetical protein
MTNPELRPATREDIVEAFRNLGKEDQSIPTRVLAMTGRVDGKVIAVGGIAIYPNGARIAFCDISDEGRRYPLSLHRGAKMVLDQAKRFGIKRIVVEADGRNHGKTPVWISRLGFRPMPVAEGRLAFVLEIR